MLLDTRLVGTVRKSLADSSLPLPATAAVAGLIANYMAEGYGATDARTQVIANAWSRQKNNPRVVWNGIDTRKLGHSKSQ